MAGLRTRSSRSKTPQRTASAMDASPSSSVARSPKGRQSRRTSPYPTTSQSASSSTAPAASSSSSPAPGDMSSSLSEAPVPGSKHRRRRSTRSCQPADLVRLDGELAMSSSFSPRSSHTPSPPPSRSTASSSSSPRRSRRVNGDPVATHDDSDTVTPELPEPISWEEEVRNVKAILPHLPSMPQQWRVLDPALVKHLHLCDQARAEREGLLGGTIAVAPVSSTASIKSQRVSVETSPVLGAVSPRMRRCYDKHSRSQ